MMILIVCKLVIIFDVLNIISGRTLWEMQNKPLPPKHGYYHKHNRERIEDIRVDISKWTINDQNNIWELSGLDEGDIMIYTEERNGLLNKKLYWPNATIPFVIDEDDFDDKQILLILKAIEEYHNKTCVRFRPYKNKDANFITIKGDQPGCWSSVGMQDKGQTVNLQKPGCVHHGVVIHELLHALGFFHQQSSTERDDYVKILYENIKEGTEHNFNKYNSNIITNYDIEYDYSSVMHYSEKAFSKNGNNTIEALTPDTKLGQREGLSKKDILKLNKMYESTCHTNKPETVKNDPFTILINWFESLFKL